MPDGFDSEHAAKWAEVAGLLRRAGQFRAEVGELVRVYVQAAVEASRARAHVAAHGAMVSAPRTGVPMHNPYRDIARQAEATLIKVAAELGLAADLSRPNPSSASVAEVGDWLGLSSRRVKELRAEGVLPGDAGDPYDLRACVRAYCAHIRPASGRAAAGGSDGAEDLDGAKGRLYSARADVAEMLADQMRGNSVIVDDMLIVVGAVLDNVRARILALPTKAAPLLMTLRAPAAIRDTLTDLVHEALHDIADSAPPCDAVVARARQRAGRAAILVDAEPSDAPAPAPHGQPMG